ncbi:carboxypeptidase-like regulatory domain-containing protein [Thermodesulfobacteriota bacterium]
MKIERLISAQKNKSPIACFFRWLLILLILSLSIGVTHGFAKDKEISGSVGTSSGNGISGVTITFSNGEGSTTTDSSGYYSQKVKEGWSGTATPSKVGYNFDPAYRNYSKVKKDQTNQDYTGILQTRTISGYIRTLSGNGFSGVTVTFDNGGGTEATDSSGYYNREVTYGWGGTVTPSKDGYSFVPASREYNNVTTDQLNQDYTGNEENELLSITINIIGSGNVEVDPDKDFHSSGSLITLVGIANSGWVFSEWSGDLNSVDNPESISINSDMIITAIFLQDYDNDGISDKEENSGPNGGDGNNDGILDSLQINVSFLMLGNATDYVAIETPPGTSIKNCQAVIDPPNNSYPSEVDFLYGFFTFAVEGIGIGGSTFATFYFPSGTTFNTYSKYGPTPDDPFNHWYEFIFDGQTGAEFYESGITLHFVDGIRGDDDLTENGIITDLGGPGIKSIIPSESDSKPYGGSHDSYGCFVGCLF